ncbi:sulfatase family protein [Brachybacterium fresconis]|uniref:Arylsulfatase A-like enzyme n=1 Tax=Brachybacterium fresconis TaxID=173363 RepID=A0ABS4YK45_9MICO|nr:sulfatase-like hydrolase/transferase [Brachybacterium fresconis]MBP2409161.1 arylsulfatase A-like enzyme [Brachybacterium fresconis]
MSTSCPDRPNILLIVSDDHGYGDRSSIGSPDARTPQLDRLAATGTTFEDAYVTAPICSPSRAGLIAGAYQQRWGAQWFDTSAFPPAERPVLPEILGGAGYRTGYFGKIHYGPEQAGDRACPDRHGFDTSLYGLAGQSMGRLHYLHHSRGAEEALGEARGVHGVSPLLENGREVDCEQHLTVAFTERAIDFMGPGAASGSTAGTAGATEGAGTAGAAERTGTAGAQEGAVSDPHAEDPFLCLVAYNAVHNFAWQLPEDELAARALPSHEDFDPAAGDYVDWYDGAISPHLEHGRDYYLAQLEIMDREIGRLLDHLEATGRRENTLVVYLTDNGGSTCNYGDNTPLAGTKYSLLEGGVRVPLLVSRPGTVPAEARSTALVSALDLLPTFAAAAGAELPSDALFDGISLLPAWDAAAGSSEGEPATADSAGGTGETGAAGAARAADGGGHEVLHFDTGFQWAVRTPDWKLRSVDPTTGHRDHLLAVEHTDVGAGLTLVPMGPGASDADESAAADVAAEHPQVVAELTALHEQWREGLAAV